MEIKAYKLVLLTTLLTLSDVTSALKFQVNDVPENLKKNILNHLHNKAYDCESVTNPISQQSQDLKKQVVTAVQPFGYFNAQVNLQKSQQNNCESVIIHLEPGPITVINQSEVNVIGDDADFNDLLALHKLKSNEPLIQPKYDAFKSQLLQLANEKLYLDANFKQQQIQVYPENNTADIHLEFELGPRYPISEVQIQWGNGNDAGKGILTEAFINKLITIKPEKFITYEDLYRLKQKLNSYGYFDQVRIEIDEQHKSEQGVPLIITLVPASKYDYSVGLGFSTDAGIKASFKYNNHRINNRGHQFTSQTTLSELSNEFTAVYKIPSKSRPANKWYNIQTGYRDESTDLVDSQTSKLGFSQTRISKNNWQNINFIDVLHEKFDTGQDQNESLLLVPGISWSLTNADSLPRPGRGYKIQAEFKGASEDIFSDASFAQITMQGKYIHSIGESNRMLYRAQIGTTASSDFNELPTTYRFFAGGDQSIRGFDYESISPINVDGDLVGGKHQAIGSIEFEHQIASQWAVAAFTDFGDAFSEELDFKYSVGAGVRWFSPIGPIRVDLGVPINKDTKDFRLHVTIGPDL